MGLGVPADAAARRGGDLDGAALRPRPCQRGRRAGRQHRRHPLACPGRSVDPLDQLRPGPEQDHADPGPRRHRRRGADRVLRPPAPRPQPALRPRCREAAALLGRCLRGADRVRLADGRHVHRPAVPAGCARVLDPGRRALDPAGGVRDGAGRPPFGEARRGPRGPLHASARLRVRAGGVPDDAAALEGGDSLLGGRARPTRWSGSASGWRGRPRRTL